MNKHPAMARIAFIVRAIAKTKDAFWQIQAQQWIAKDLSLP